LSRHSRIADQLNEAQKQRIIQGWAKDQSPNEPQRIRWFVRVGQLDQLYATTPEVEAFLTGVKAAIREPLTK
jgi:hypothetical protein